MINYTVKPGDTLFKIAQNFNTTVENILELNPAIKNPNLINIGQVIIIESSGTGEPQPCPSGNLLINSSFEDWAVPDQNPSGWQVNNVYRTTLSNYGYYAAEMGAAAPNRQAALTQITSVQAVNTYRLEFYLRESEQFGGVSQYQMDIKVVFYNNSMQVTGQVNTVLSQTAIPNNSFQLYTLTTDKAPINSTSAEVRFNFMPASRNDNTVVVDNVVFYCLPE
ncbi:Peptidoglycan-binding LysM [Desulfofarcimen acetoxidans DSM 771]|uniref:Peptidoglycan-binding LysM n=1 Tax=Desulfofarcimen acetoxidans (strain ATCC 49208 / DSM 771 / KCTC 5769 / VKM B-1644 / 5575) TaxID=485916 RepID=C8W491_DESAS|nr:LysM domain-containing protein [Desulfofarcimen acetoxidans]ACV61959.1 Peptidoglycan-binding LysM [Desulfofarcimen acetoxidans DSM 771]